MSSFDEDRVIPERDATVLTGRESGSRGVMSPDSRPASQMSSRARRRVIRRRRIIISTVVVAIVLAASGAATAYAVNRPVPLTQRYVLGTVATGDLTSTLTYTGSVSKANQKSLYFPTSGKVASVNAVAGDSVGAGDVIATMDTTSLSQAVNAAQANLDQANLALWNAQNPSSASTAVSSSGGSGLSGSGGSSSGGSSASGLSGPGGSGSLGSSLSSVAATYAQARTEADKASQDVTSECAAAMSTLQPGSEPSGSPDSTQAPTPDVTATPDPGDTATLDTPTSDPGETPVQELGDTPTPDPGETPVQDPGDSATPTVDPGDSVTDPGYSPESISACLTAVLSLQKAETTLSNAADQLSQVAQQVMTTSAATQQCSTSNADSSTISVVTSGSSTTRTSSSASASGISSSGSSVSVATAQAQVKQAQTALDQAQSNLAEATMTSPIDGVVAQLSFAVGDTVSASTPVIVIGSGPANVVLSVPVARVPLVAEDQQATIAQNSLTVPATVSSVSLLPTSGTNYSVTVTSTDPEADQLLAGAPATVTITTATISSATLVPISAITLDSSGTSGTVQVVSGDQVNEKTVTVSAVGDTEVAVNDGVTAGDKVVLADTTTALPTSTNGVTRAISGSSGGGGVSVTTGTSGMGPR